MPQERCLQMFTTEHYLEQQKGGIAKLPFQRTMDSSTGAKMNELDL